MKKNYQIRSLALFTLLTLGAASLIGQTTVSLPLIAVGKISSTGVPGTDLSGISTTTGQNRGWMKFDLSVIPAGSTVNTATLSYPTIAGTVNSTSTANQLNALGFDPALATWASLNSPNAGVNNIFTGAWSGTHPLALTTAAAPGGSVAATTALINYLQLNVGNPTASFSLIRGSTNIYNFNTAPTLSVTYTLPVACSGTPAPSVVLANPTQVCPGASTALSLSTSYTGIGDLIFQWQSSSDSLTWADISGANSVTYSTAPSAVTFYRCVITCANSSLSDTADAVKIIIKPFLECYCNSIPQFPDDEEIYSVTVNGNSTNPLYAGANGCTTVAPGPNSILNRYSNFTTLGPLTSLLQGIPASFSVVEDECDGATYFDNGIAIWIDFNQNGSLADPGEQVFAESATSIGPRTVTGSFNVPANALLGNTLMRVICAESFSGAGLTPCMAYNYGETEDFIVDILPAPACTNPPIPGTLAGADSLCPNTSSTVTLSGYSLGSDLQWQSSPDGQTWTDVSGATNPTLNISISTGTYYRVAVSCIDTLYSDTLLVSIKPFLQCYCASSANFADDEEIYSVTVNGNSTNPLYAGANGCATVAPGPGSVLGQYSNFTTLAPLSTIYPGSVVSFSIEQDECDGAPYYANGIAIWVDLNQNGLLTDAGEQVFVENVTATGPRTLSGTFVVPSNAVLGNTLMRIICAEGLAGAGLTPCLTYGYGETEDFIVDVQTPPACTTPADAGTASGPDTASVGPPATYILSGYTGGGIGWQFATDSLGPWSDIAGSNTDTIPLFFNGPGTFYLRAIVFQTGCPNDTSNFVQTVIVFRGNDVCDAVELTFGVNGPFSTNAATIQPGEPAPPATGCAVQTGWCNNTITNTLWFKFVAPASGRVSIQSPDFDTQLALWSASTCDSILLGGATLLFANDDDPNSSANGGAMFSSKIDSAICLTPGVTYYVQLDPYTSPGGFTEIVFTDLGPGPVASFTGLNPSYCPDAAPAVLTPGTPGGSFFGLGLTQDSIFDPSLALTQVSAGTPIVIYYQLWACYQATDTVVVDTLPVATVNGQTNVSCYGGNNGAIDVITSGAAPFTYAWSSSETTEDISGLVAGSYTLTVTDSKGCSSELSSISITEPSEFMLMFDSVLNVKCNGDASGSVFVSPMGGTSPYSYLWNNQTTTEDLISVNAGAYSVTASDDLGCSATLSASITEPLAITIAVDSTVANLCAGNNAGAIYVTVTNGTQPYAFLWSNSDTTEDVTALTGGNYTLSVNDAIGCNSSFSTSINDPAALAASLDSIVNPSCNGSGNGVVLISVSGGTVGYTYNWSNGATTEDLSALAGGTFTGTVTDANGCTIVASATLTEPAALALTVDSVRNVSCFGGNNGAAFLTITGGTANYTYLWSNNFTGQDQPNLVPGSYTISATDFNGCSVVASTSITQPASGLSSSSISTDQVLNGNSGAIDLTVSGGTSPYTYLWSNGATTEDLSTASAGNYSCTITDANGCTRVQSDTVDLIIGIEETENAFALNLYPNPNNAQFTIDVLLAKASAISIEVVNVNGQIVATQTVAESLSKSFVFDLVDVAEGVYFARIKAGENTVVRRFIVTR